MAPSFIARSVTVGVVVGVTGLFAACGSDYAVNHGDSFDAGSSATDAGGGKLDASAADGGSPGTDSGSGGTGADAGTGPRCNPSKAWGAPQPVTSLNTAGIDMSARLTADETLVFFLHADVPPAHTFVAQRAGASGPFGPSAQVPVVNTANSDTYNVSPTGDGLTVYFESNRNNLMTGVLSLFVGTRPTLASPFTVTAITTVPADITQPYVTPSGKSLYYVSASHIWSAPIVSGAVGAGTDVGLPSGSITPVVSPDELTIYFATNASTDGGSDFDIYTATRASTAGPFKGMSVVPGVNTASGDYPTFVSADGCELWISSLVTTNGDIYLSTKPL